MEQTQQSTARLNRYVSFRITSTDMERISRMSRAAGATRCELIRAILAIEIERAWRIPRDGCVVVTELALLGRGTNQMARAKNNAYYAAEALTRLSSRAFVRREQAAELYNDVAGGVILTENELWRLYRLYRRFSPRFRSYLDLLFETPDREPIPILDTPPHTGKTVKEYSQNEMRTDTITREADHQGEEPST